MVRNLEVGDKVTIRPFIGNDYYTGKIIKIGNSYIHVEVLKIDGCLLFIPRTMIFNKNTFIGVGKDKMYEITDKMFDEHEKYV